MTSSVQTDIDSTASPQTLSVVTIVYHPKDDLANAKEEEFDLVFGDKISVSALERVFKLRFVEECDIEGRNEIGIPFDASTGDSRNSLQLAEDGKFHITGEPQIDVSQHQPQNPDNITLMMSKMMSMYETLLKIQHRNQVEYIRNAFPLLESSTQKESARGKINLVSYYNYNPGNPSKLPSRLKCMISGCYFSAKYVTMAHIFQKLWASRIDMVGLDDVNHVRNLLLLFRPIEVHFDRGDLIFMWDEQTKQHTCRILNPRIKTLSIDDEADNLCGPAVADKTGMTFGDLEGKVLDTNNSNHMPYKRCLAFHAQIATTAAASKKWVNLDDYPISPSAWSDLEDEKKEIILNWLGNGGFEGLGEVDDLNESF
ncbi:hypothetical protein MP638_002596 [Amoeboaphelidium occidentale]|nr:hypothetical protein MP638_002596 [Amoeboaphelidium occidentale]